MTPLYAPWSLDADLLGPTAADKLLVNGVERSGGEVLNGTDDRIAYRVFCQPFAVKRTSAGTVAARRAAGPVVIGTPDWYEALGGDPDDADPSPTGWGAAGRPLRLPRVYCGPPLPEAVAAALRAAGVDQYPPPDLPIPADETFVENRVSARPAEAWVPVGTARHAPRCLVNLTDDPPVGYPGNLSGEPVPMLDIAPADLGRTRGGMLYLACPAAPEFTGGTDGLTVRTLNFGDPGTPPPEYPQMGTFVESAVEPAATDGYTRSALPLEVFDGVVNMVEPNPDYDPEDPLSPPFLHWNYDVHTETTPSVYRPTTASEEVFALLRTVYDPRCERLRIAGEEPDEAGADFGYTADPDTLSADVLAFFGL